jgi:uncharacterized protein (DUF58 family)
MMRSAWESAAKRGWQEGARYALDAGRRSLVGYSGLHEGRAVGSGIDFMEHRPYEPGDDLRHVDWAAYARTDRLHVRVYRQEVSPHLDLLIDGSRSMDLPDSQKAAAAIGLASTLCASAIGAGFTCSAWLLGDPPHLLPGADPTRWPIESFEGARPPGEILSHGALKLRPLSIRVLISDLLWDGDPALTIAPLAHRGAAAWVLQVLAGVDVDPPSYGAARLIDSESSGWREMFIDAPMRRRYTQALGRHHDLWHAASIRHQAVHRRFVAESFLRDWDLTPLLEAAALKPV